MWFFEVKYGNNCILGGHFYSTEEMLEWFSVYLRYYVLVDHSYDIRIFFKEDTDEEY